MPHAMCASTNPMVVRDGNGATHSLVRLDVVVFLYFFVDLFVATIHWLRISSYMTISNISWNDDDDDDAATVTLHSFTLMLCVHISTSSKVRKMEMKNRRENGPKNGGWVGGCVRACVCVRWWELSSKICPAMMKPFSYIRPAVTCGLNWVSSYKHVCTHKSVSLFAILQHGKLLLLLLFLSSTSSFWKMKMQNKPQNVWRKWLARSHENCACTFICICTYLWGDWT